MPKRAKPTALDRVFTAGAKIKAVVEKATDNAMFLDHHGALQAYLAEFCGNKEPFVDWDQTVINRLSGIKVRAVDGRAQFKGEFANCWFEHDGTLPSGRQWHEA